MVGRAFLAFSDGNTDKLM